MRVRLLLFASYAEFLGDSELSIDVPEGSSAGDVLASVRARKGGERLPPNPLLAINQRYAKAEAAVKDGDEVALIPPVAGG